MAQKPANDSAVSVGVNFEIDDAPEVANEHVYSALPQANDFGDICPLVALSHKKGNHPQVWTESFLAFQRYFNSGPRVLQLCGFPREGI